MNDPTKFDCPYCDKKYVRGGFLPSHISKYHEDALLLDQNMTAINEIVADLSTQEAGLNLSENPFYDDIDEAGLNTSENPPVENQENTAPPRSTSTPSAAAPVPLCPKANK